MISIGAFEVCSVSLKKVCATFVYNAVDFEICIGPKTKSRRNIDLAYTGYSIIALAPEDYI